MNSSNTIERPGPELFFYRHWRTGSSITPVREFSKPSGLAESASEFGDLVKHHGEEFIYVIEGAIEVHSEFYDPLVLEQGQSIYLDSSMGHAYVAAKGCDEAVVLGVCSSADDGLLDSLKTSRG
ncbi:cupin domain-containing protein [Qipengyuania pacifica]|uniref:cupin domain-containing protein n=1 Tax=Qipengyuania pacifica TaxID=2860199 RepID=UPI0031E9C0A1